MKENKIDVLYKNRVFL